MLDSAGAQGEALFMFEATLPYPAIDPVLIHIGPLAIRWYAIPYIAGLLLGWGYILRLLAVRGHERYKAILILTKPVHASKIDIKAIVICNSIIPVIRTIEFPGEFSNNASDIYLSRNISPNIGRKISKDIKLTPIYPNNIRLKIFKII